ncbi:MAG TPA: hypothetical protein VIU64_22790 [Polyangia bacterium]
MAAIDKDLHRPWLAYALEEALEHALIAPKDVINHANPEVLVTQLPPPVISLLLSRALTIGTFSPAQVLESVPPAVLAEHLDPEVMWRCLKDASDRGGLSRVGGTRSTDARQWFASVLGRALEGTLVTPADVLRFLPPSEYAGAAPRSVMAELLKEALATSRFDPDLVLQHLTPTVIAENLETSLVWDCITDAVVRNFELGGATPAKANGTGNATKSGTIGSSAPPAAAPAAISIKPPAKEKLEERTPPPGSLNGAAAAAKALGHTPGPSRVEAAASRAGAVAASVPATPTARHVDDDWTPAADDRRFPFPR